MFNKKGMLILLGLVVTLMMLVLAACGGAKGTGQTSSPPQASGPAATEKEKPAAQPAQKITLKLGHTESPESTKQKVALKFKEALEQKTDGQYVIDIYPAGQLGNQGELLEGISKGALDLTIEGISYFSKYDPNFNVLDAPFLYDNAQAAAKIMVSPPALQMYEGVRVKTKVRVLDPTYIRPARYLISKKPVNTPEELKKLTLRMPPLKIFQETWAGMGAKYTVIAWPETYNALAQGVVDGVEGTLNNFDSMKFTEQAKYITMVAPMSGTSIPIFIADPLYEKLSPEMKKVFAAAAQEAAAYGTKLEQDLEGQTRKKLEGQGVTFIEADPKPFKDMIRDLPQKLEEQNLWQKGLYQELQKYGK